MRPHLLLVSLFLTVCATPVWAQGPPRPHTTDPPPAEEIRSTPREVDTQHQRRPCEASIVSQRILDLKDHREWLEGQLALAKALLNETRRSLAQKEAELAACRTGHEDPR